MRPQRSQGTSASELYFSKALSLYSCVPGAATGASGIGRRRCAGFAASSCSHFFRQDRWWISREAVPKSRPQMWHVTKRALLGDLERDEGASRIDSAGDEGVSRIGTAGDLGRDAHGFTDDLDRDAARFICSSVGPALLLEEKQLLKRWESCNRSGKYENVSPHPFESTLSNFYEILQCNSYWIYNLRWR